MGIKEPKCTLPGILSKVKRTALKAITANNLASLCVEFTDFSGPKNVIGSACQQLGITPSWLKEGCSALQGEVSNGIIAELFHYCRQNSIPWKTVLDEWWCRLFPEKADEVHVPPMGTVQSSWKSVAEKKQTLSRDSSRELLEEFLRTPYSYPTKKPIKEEQLEDKHTNGNEPPLVTQNDSGDDTLSTCDDVSSPYLLRKHGDTLAVLHELLETEKRDKKDLERQLLEVTSERNRAEQLNDENAARVNNAEGAVKEMMKSHQKECCKYQTKLKKADELCKQLEKEISSLSRSNVVRRLATKEKQLEREKGHVSELQEEIMKLNHEVDELMRLKKNRTEQVRYNTKKRTKIENKMDAENVQLKEQLREIERQNDTLRSQLDEIMGDKEISCYENGAFSSDIRTVCYELLAKGISPRHISDIIRLVLKRLTGLNCGRLPKASCIRYMTYEQALLAKHVAKDAVEKSSCAVTLQTDGTSKKHQSYVTMLTATEYGTYGLSLTEVLTEDADTLLNEAMSAMRELLSLEVISAETEKRAELLLAKVKNTMTDRCIVNKKFIRLLEEWRQKFLPSVIDNWEQLSGQIKKEMASVNDLYCGKHLVLNFQEYATAALQAWETVESAGRKLGRESHMPWNKKSESAAMLAVRTVCEAFGPDAHPQAGCPQEFKAYIKQNYLRAYRGNRFNVPFENSAATYYHYVNNHFKDVCNTLPARKQSNTLIKSVMWDLEDNIILGGIRAMGILCVHISTPLMHMIESRGHVMDTDRYYTRLHDFVYEQMEDPSDLLNDSAVLYPEYPPKENEVRKGLYSEVNEEVDFYTKQSIIIILHNIFVCIKRQLEDHLPGGKHHNVDSRVHQETETCPRDNIAAERIFAGLDYLKRSRPNLTVLAMQGILLWSQNKSMEYLDKCSEEEKSKLIKAATKNKRIVMKSYQDKVKEMKKERQEMMSRQQQAKEEKKRKLVATAVRATEMVNKLCDGPCTSSADVESMMSMKAPSDQREALLAQIDYYKSVNKGLAKGALFFKSKAGKPLSSSDLCNNLKEIIRVVNLAPISQSEDAESGRSVTFPDSDTLQEERKALREKLLSKVTGRKRKEPFPETAIVHKRIKHKFLPEGGKRLVTYHGRVLRKSTQQDIEDLMESSDQEYLDKGYTFYTLMYDNDEDLYTYPLEKEWEDNCLELIHK